MLYVAIITYMYFPSEKEISKEWTKNALFSEDSFIKLSLLKKVSVPLSRLTGRREYKRAGGSGAPAVRRIISFAEKGGR